MSPLPALALLATTPLAAAAEEPSFIPEIQFRPRYEFDTGRDGVPTEGEVHFITHRARLGAVFSWEPFSACAILQDVRVWGEESDTRRDFSADGLDLVIGTFTWAPTTDLRLVIGRDEVQLHGERLVGRANWRQPGRHFDGARLTFDDETWAAEVAGFMTVEGDRFDFATTDQVRPAYGDQTLWWVRGGRESEALTAQALLVVDDRSARVDEGIIRWTPGVFLEGRRGPFSVRAEAYRQFGTLPDQRVRAWMLGLLGTVAPDLPGRPALTLGYDVISGDHDPHDAVSGQFNTLYGANHRYYGHIDIAYNRRGGPSDDRGLHDPFVRLEGRPAKWLVARLDQHLFAPFSRPGPGQLLAAETDLQLQFRPHEALSISTGASVWAPLSGSVRPVEAWAWLMLDVAWRGPTLSPPPTKGVHHDATS